MRGRLGLDEKAADGSVPSSNDGCFARVRRLRDARDADSTRLVTPPPLTTSFEGGITTCVRIG